MLEGYAAGLCAEKRTWEDIRGLDDLCAAMEREAACSSPNFDRISADNVAFHRAIATIADNVRLLACLEPLWNVPLMVRKYGLFGEERLKRSLHHHRELISAIERRDLQWAEAVMRTHILAARAVDGALGQEDEQDDRNVEDSTA